MVYSHHLRLLLHFVGKKNLDLPFYLYRSLAKISDKVQVKSEVNETSLFHHGLIKLLVLEELKILGRDWSSFLFVSGFEVDSITPKITPKHRDIPSPSMAKQIETVIMETDPLHNVGTPKFTHEKQKR